MTHDIHHNNLKESAMAKSVPFTDVAVADSFWSARQKQIVCVTVMAGISNVEAPGGGISNFVNTAKLLRGEPYEPHMGKLYVDSDVHKLIEAMCYALQMDAQGDEQILQAQKKIADKIEEWMPHYQGSQEEDGYFDTYFTLAHPKEKWSNFNLHELYCAGHFYEMAVAHYRMTGGKDRRFFDMAIKNADYVCSLFGPGKWKQVPGHQEIELALLKLAILCREIGVLDGVDYAAKAERYVELSQYFLDTRGDHADRHGINLDPDMCQDELPLTQQTTALSHAVRAQYMYTAMVDAMVQSGKDSYNNVLLALWDSVNTKTYATGGVGVSDHHEGFGPDYYMPLSHAYCETCAGIANIMWNQRMNLLFGQSKYADKMEHVLHNAMLSGINLDGNRFFYTNVVSTSGRERVRWYGTACCPPNLMRTVLSLGGYVYAQKADEIRLNLFIGNEARLKVADGDVQLKVLTGFPWHGNVKVEVHADGPRDFTLRLRLPGWATGENEVSLNGTPISATPDADGYITLHRVWQDGDTVAMELPMQVQSVPLVEGVAETKDYMVFRRGPVVYALEQAGGNAIPKQYVVEKTPVFTHNWVENLDGKEDPYGLRGVMTVTTTDARTVGPDGRENVPMTLVPYYATANRGPVAMEVYISTVPRQLPLEYFAEASASYTYTGNQQDSVKNLNDGNASASSRWTSYCKTLKEDPWVAYTFQESVTVSGCEVMWYDDGGGVRIPDDIIIEYWDQDRYVEVTKVGKYTYFPQNDFGGYSFDPVVTRKLRMTMKNAKSQRAVGIIEWKLIGSAETV